ncbi:D-alanyl-D-alanine carboxypeptidase family protein [Desulfitispora alkaliphila]|uniref:D-alanyl-D-alanine carboxypeptidase family protein n=1 Tax=Desulfitispora alkaliphila TaxID=622674 RepID=UPI003D1A48A6
MFFLLCTQANALEVDAKAAILLEPVTGTVIYEKNPDQILPIASTTKILTGIIAIEMGDINEKVVVSERAANTGEASIHLIEGETIELRDLLLGLLIKSGNDSAVAIAEHIAGSVEDFCHLMNKKAISIGANSSNFVNPHGLPDHRHYSNARDLAKIANYAMENGYFAELVQIRNATIPYPEGGTRFLKNTNKLLKSMPDCIGIKTGTTNKAGPCLVAAAERDNTRMISVVLNSPDRFGETEKILNYGLDKYKFKEIISEGDIIKRLEFSSGKPNRINAFASEGFIYLVEREKKDLIRTEVELHPKHLPILKGDVIGEVNIYLGEELLGSVNALASESVEYSIMEHMRNFGRDLKLKLEL